MSAQEFINRRTIEKLLADTGVDDPTQLLELYADELKLLVDNLGDHIRNENLTQLLLDIHTAKSSAAIFGAEVLYRSARSVEKLGDQSGSPIWGPATETLDLARDTLHAVRQIAGEYTTGGSI